MNYRILYVLLEGDDDKRFIDSIVIPRIAKAYNSIQVVKYSQMKDEKLIAYITSIRAMKGAEYLILTDIDYEPCVTRKKEKLIQKYKAAEIERVIVVKKEIESWYLAGLSSENTKRLRINSACDNKETTKETFDNLIPRTFLNRTDFMMELLKCYAFESAQIKNDSFRYLCSRLYLT